MRLIGVGVGPGDPELVTVKAVRLLNEAGRVFVPVLDAGDTGRAEATVRTHVTHDRVERLVFALNEREDAARRSHYWDAAGARVAQWLREEALRAHADQVGAAPAGGVTAAFATIGDPNIYATFGYLAQTVRELVPELVVETVAGITAMQALAATAGQPLVEGSEPLTLLPLARDVTPLKEALAADGTVVVYKGGRHLDEIARIAAEAGRSAVYGAHLGLPDEEVQPLSDVEGPGPYLATVLIPANRSTRGGKL